MRKVIPDHIISILRRFEDAGFEACLVGGCVRDHLSGRPPHDFDITVSALPGETKELFSGSRIIETGIKHGTVTVLAGGEPVEITTFRTDGDYSDARHPDSVSFTRSLRDDLARRDFTINAIAYSLSDGYSDPFGGMNDLSAGLLRAVGTPEARFSEDALRIMRGLRFSAVYGYRIESGTSDAMRSCAHLLDKVSGERLYAELKALLCGEHCGGVILEYCGVLDHILPGLAAMRGCKQRHPYHIYDDVLGHTVKAVESIPAEPVLRLAALLHDFGKPDCVTVDDKGITHFHGHPKQSVRHAEEIMDRLRCDRRTRDDVAELVLRHDARIPAEKPAIKRWLGRLGETQLRRLFALMRADILAQNPAEPYILRLNDIERSLSLLDDILAGGDCVAVRDLKINGRDLIGLGFEPGPGIGRTLNALLESVIDGKVENERAALLDAAAKMRGCGH